MSETVKRIKTEPLEISVSDLSNNIKLLQSNIDEQGRRLTWFMAHSDAIQQQIQESLQRQLDQNQEQHKEMMNVFKSQNEASNGQMEYFLQAAESRIDDIVKKQAQEDIERNNRIKIVEDNIISIKEEPLKKSFKKIEVFKVSVASVIITLVATSGYIMVTDFIKMGAKISIPIEVPK